MKRITVNGGTIFTLIFIKTARSLVTINTKTVSPNENAHTFARLSLTVRASNNTRIEDIPHFN